LTTIPVAGNGNVACVAIEPEPGNYRYLANNVQRNCPQGNVALLNLALFDRQTKMDFELSKQNGGDHRVRLTDANGSYGEHARKVIQVAADKLDAIFAPSSLKLPLAAKIDTQGAECQVFAGGQTTLSRAELVAFEYWPYGIQRLGGDPDFLADFVAQNFVEGAIVNGERDERPVWRPIRAIRGELTAHWRSDATAYRYFDVFVRK